MPEFDPLFHPFSVLPEPFSGTHPDSTIFRYSPGPFSGTRPDPSPVLARTFLRYSPGFYPFSVLARTLLRYSPGFYPFSVLARNLLRYSPGPFFGTRPELFRYLPEAFSSTHPELSPVLARTLFRYSPEFYPFSVLARIPPFFGTRLDSTVFRYLPKPFSDTCPDHIPNLSRHRDRVSFSLSPASCLDPIVHSVSMTYFP